MTHAIILQIVLFTYYSVKYDLKYKILVNLIVKLSFCGEPAIETIILEVFQ